MKIISLILFCFFHSVSCPPQEESNYQQNDCDFFSGLSASNSIHCGMVLVPENHQNKNGRKIKIAYAVIPAYGPSPSLEPMIHFSGGPGAATLTEGLLQFYLNHEIRKDHDIILFDQRGIGHSSPLPDLDPEIFEIMAGNFDSLEEHLKIAAHMDVVKNRCIDQGIQLAYYNSYQSAQDVGMLMKELDYSSYNLYGGSYGTRLARIVMEMFPEQVHSAILNSPNPPGGDFLIDRLHSYSLALSRIFEYCQNDPSCYEPYPELKSDYLSALEMLRKEPLQVQLHDSQFFVNPQDAIYILRRQLYRTNSRTQAPALIHELKNGGGPILRSILESEFRSNDFYNFSMWISVEKYEFINPENTSEIVNKQYAQLALLPERLGFFHSFYEASKNWHDGIITAEERRLTDSSVPSIIFVNQYDPVTPPEYGPLLQKHLSQSTLFVMDEAGHGGGDMDCRAKVMCAFMKNPRGKFDHSCLNLYEPQN